MQVTTPHGTTKVATAVLEDIVPKGATIQIDEPLVKGASVNLHCSNCSKHRGFRGKVRRSMAFPDLGKFADIEFSEDSQLPPNELVAQEAADPAVAQAEATAAQARMQCCPGGYCRHLIVSCAVAPTFNLRRHIRLVAHEVAQLCGGMDRKTTSACFSKLLQCDPGCRLFSDFYGEYAHAQRKGKAATSREPLATSAISTAVKVVWLQQTIPAEVLPPAASDPLPANERSFTLS